MSSQIADLRRVLERLHQAAEQYLDTEHRDRPRDLELRRNLGDASADAALLLHQPCPTCQGNSRETAGMVCQTCGRDYAPEPSDV